MHRLNKEDKVLFNQEIDIQLKIILLNYKYWCNNSFEEQGINEKEKNKNKEDIQSDLALYQKLVEKIEHIKSRRSK